MKLELGVRRKPGLLGGATIDSSSVSPFHVIFWSWEDKAGTDTQIYFALYEVNASLCQRQLSTRRQDVWASGSVSPWMLNLGIGWGWAVIVIPVRLYPRRKSLRYPLGRRLGGLRASLDLVVLKNICATVRNRITVLKCFTNAFKVNLYRYSPFRR